MKKWRRFFLALLLALGPWTLAPIGNAAFSDLPSSHLYFRSIDYLEGKNIIGGYSDGSVRPDNLINRAEFLKLLLEGLDVSLQAGSACFSDILGDEWFAPYVCSAKANGIVSGLPDGSFAPARNINKAETHKIVVNTMGLTLQTSLSAYTDVPQSAWFHDFVSTLEAGNYLEESGTSLKPAENYSRGQISEILYRILITQEQGKQRFDGPSAQQAVQEGQLKAWRQLALDHINQLRSENGVGPVVMNDLLNDIAQAHSDDMSRHIKAMSHDGSLGEQAHERIKEGKVPNSTGTGFDSLPVPKGIGWSGENVGKRNINHFGGSIQQALIDQHNWFMDEPPDEPNHRTTMLSTLYPFTQVGIGLTLDEQGNLWITEDYISILQ